MVKITNLSTAQIALGRNNLAPGQSRNVENINASLDKLIQGGALKAETVKAVRVVYRAPQMVPTKTFRSYKKEKN